MSKVIDLYQDSDDGEWPNTASCPSPQFLGKRSRDREESLYDARPPKENGPGKKTSVAFVFDLDLADKADVSPYRKRRGVVTSEKSTKDDAAGKYLQSLEGVEAAEKVVRSEDAQAVDHCASHEGIAAASQPMNSNTEQTGQNGGSTNKDSQKQSTSKPASIASGRQGRRTWKDRLSELADYRKSHGHCNVPQHCSENSKLAQWVATQRSLYRLQEEGKKRSRRTLCRRQALENLGFEWQISSGQLKTAPSNKMIRANPVAAEPLEQRHNGFTHSILRGDGVRLAPPGKAMPLLTESDSNTDTATANDNEQILASATALQQALMQATAARRESGESESSTYSALISEISGKSAVEAPERVQATAHTQEEVASATALKQALLQAAAARREGGSSTYSAFIFELSGKSAVEAPEHVQTTAQTQEEVSARDIRSDEGDVAAEPEECVSIGEIYLAYVPWKTEEI
jgi:hypothetical protein